jgi:hypothetical protein
LVTIARTSSFPHIFSSRPARGQTLCANKNSRFFQNTGAVAGTFSAVGVAVVAIVGLFVYKFFKNRRTYDDDEFFEKYPSEAEPQINSTGGYGASHGALSDPDAGHSAMEHASATAYPDRAIHYGQNEYTAGGNTAQAYDFGDVGLSFPPNASFAGGETDSRPTTQYAGVGAGFMPSHVPQQYQEEQDPYYQSDYQQQHAYSDPAVAYQKNGSATYGATAQAGVVHDPFYGGGNAR